MKKGKNIKITKENKESNLKNVNNKEPIENNLTNINNNKDNNDIKNNNDFEDISKNKIFKQKENSKEIILEKKKERTTQSNEFQGFFFKKFNLTTYKRERDDSRERSKSPERIYKLNYKKGNGIPDDLIERLNYFTKIINNENFQKYYNKRPKEKTTKFEDIVNYLINYSKNHNELEVILMLYYYICNEIKCYTKEAKEKMKEKKDQLDHNILDEENYNEGNNPKIEDIFYCKMALSSIDFTNFFEYFLKKLEIKHKHINGYCKLYENKKEKRIKLNLKSKIKFNTTSNFSKFRSKSTSSFDKNLYLPENLKNHNWNAVYIKGQWYFIDTFFGSGGIIKEAPNPQLKFIKSKIKKIFNIYYFMTPPQYLIYTHRPIEDDWQFIDKTLTFPQFFYKKIINFGEFYKGVFENGIELLSHKYPLIEIKNNEHLKIKLRAIGNILEGELYNVNLLNKVGEIKINFDEEKKIYIFEPIFPYLGEFILRINSRPTISTDLIYTPLFDYRIKVTIPFKYLYFEKYKLLKDNENNKIKEKRTEELLLPKLTHSTSQFISQPKIISDYSRILPSKTNKIICYDNQDFHLIEPRTKILRKGVIFKFKIKIKGATNVSLLDGNHWTPFRRTEEDIYEGHKEIETDNVSICCLRNKNVYTEVIKFMIYKDRSILSKTTFPSSTKKIKKNNIKNSKFI